MKRRAFSVTALCVLGLPLAARAQPRKARVGFLGGTAPDAIVQRNLIEPFRQSLRELGHEEGRNGFLADR